MTKPSRLMRFAGSHDLRCQTCSLSALCVPSTLTLRDVERFESLTRQWPPLHKRQTLLHQESPFSSLFVVRSGSLKQTSRCPSGEDQITHFFLPGELVGLDALGERRYPGTVTALETTTVCEIPYHHLDGQGDSVIGLREHLFQVMSRELHHERMLVRLLLRRTSDVRLASFFVAMSARFQRRGYSPHRFRLAMSRADIGSYLGLAVETVSRLLGRFQQSGLMTTRGREFEILDSDGLNRLAEGEGR
ncbi:MULTISPECIES: helix-turn-helix domain-containing protein [unclassified Modicisalibacter]|uniref:helix-turn-helix domain-containing protein n=1 Tax=unclassified Modicisalibacter TaxID=2679913 RepID=UPI001CCB22BC|nr:MULTISPECIES: helix-turn-helix domain-containing protein [unclassified Modicisalibacter]